MQIFWRWAELFFLGEGEKSKNPSSGGGAGACADTVATNVLIDASVATTTGACLFHLADGKWVGASEKVPICRGFALLFAFFVTDNRLLSGSRITGLLASENRGTYVRFGGPDRGRIGPIVRPQKPLQISGFPRARNERCRWEACGMPYQLRGRTDGKLNPSRVLVKCEGSASGSRASSHPDLQDSGLTALSGSYGRNTLDGHSSGHDSPESPRESGPLAPQNVLRLRRVAK